MKMNNLFDLYAKECIPELQPRSQRDYLAIVEKLRACSTSADLVESSHRENRAISWVSPVTRGHLMKVRCDKGRPQVRIPCGIQPEDSADEKWLPVPGWEKFYMVSNLGRVWSMHQYGRFITGMEVAGGYRVVKMRDNHRYAHIAVHVLVLMAFRGPRPAYNYQGCHNDGQPRNNALSNLRWDTVAANQADRKKHGTFYFTKPTKSREAA